MKLDKWYYTNQDDQHIKHVAQQLVGGILGYPSDVYEKRPVKMQNVNMPKRDDLISMVLDDGFTEWGEAYKSVNGRPSALSIAVKWTKMSCLREISENGYNTVLVTDNVYPKVFYAQLIKLLAHVPDDIYGLCLSGGESTLITDGIEIDGRNKLFASAIGNSFYYLLTPEGATVFLDLWRQDARSNYHEIVFRAYQKAPDNFPVHKWYRWSPSLVVHSGLIFGDRQSLLSVRDH